MLLTRANHPYLQHSGRFGLTPEQSEQLDRSITQTAKQLKRTRTGIKTLCVGTGEFMYIPMRIAAEMGDRGVLPIDDEESNSYH